MKMDPSSAVLHDNFNEDLILDQRKGSYLPSPENYKKRKFLNADRSPVDDDEESRATLGGSPIGRRNI